MRIRNLVVVIGLGLAVAASAADPDCSAFGLNGYTLGMPREEAEAVRPTKDLPKIVAKAYAKLGDRMTARSVPMPDGKDGTLTFDAENRVVAWTREVSPQLFDQLVAEISDRHGPPEVDDVGKRLWVDRACDVQIALVASGGVSVVGFQRYSLFKSGAADALK